MTQIHIDTVRAANKDIMTYDEVVEIYEGIHDERQAYITTHNTDNVYVDFDCWLHVNTNESEGFETLLRPVYITDDEGYVTEVIALIDEKDYYDEDELEDDDFVVNAETQEEALKAAIKRLSIGTIDSYADISTVVFEYDGVSVRYTL